MAARADAVAPSNSKPLDRVRVEHLLTGMAPTAAALRALGSGAFEALRDLFDDPDEPSERRARALAALGVLADARALALLKGVLLDPSTSPLFSRTALFALARNQGSAAVPVVAAQLQVPDPTVRLAAAEALGEIGGVAAHAALQKQLDAEVRPEVRAALERALAKANP